MNSLLPTSATHGRMMREVLQTVTFADRRGKRGMCRQNSTFLGRISESVIRRASVRDSGLRALPIRPKGYQLMSSGMGMSDFPLKISRAPCRGRSELHGMSAGRLPLFEQIRPQVSGCELPRRRNQMLTMIL
jgi:hypothetical protein